MITTYRFWRNIYDVTFEEWWKDHKELVFALKESEEAWYYKLPAVRLIDVKEFIAKRFKIFIKGAVINIKNFISYNGGDEPTWLEFGDVLLEDIKKMDWRDKSFFIEINTQKPFTIKKLKKEFSAILEKHLPMEKISFRDFKKNTNEKYHFILKLLPTKEIKYIEDIKNYLEIYRLRKKYKHLTWREFIKKIRPKYGATDIDNLIREYRRYFAKAKRIIRNVELGYFPGEYQEDPNTTMKKLFREAKGSKSD